MVLWWRIQWSSILFIYIINFFLPLQTDFSLCDVIPNLVSIEENATLIAIPKASEIKQAVFSLNPNSAPGPDGYSGLFYQKCWDIVGRDVVLCIQAFFKEGWLPPNLNSNLITLIPKVVGADSVSQFRPIAMANFVFKIIPKILADRLANIAARIVSQNQVAFIKGRRIHDCIGIVSENINLLDKKNFFGNLGLKIDIYKAFDTLFWSFLCMVLHKFGFHDKLG